MQLKALTDNNLRHLTEKNVIYQKIRHNYGKNEAFLVTGDSAVWMTKLSDMELKFKDNKEQLFAKFHRQDESYTDFKSRVMTPPEDFETQLLPPGKFSYTIRNRVSFFSIL